MKGRYHPLHSVFNSSFLLSKLSNLHAKDNADNDGTEHASSVRDTKASSSVGGDLSRCRLFEISIYSDGMDDRLYLQQ